MKKRIIAGLLAFLLVFSNVNISVFATEAGDLSATVTETTTADAESGSETESENETESVTESEEASVPVESESEEESEETSGEESFAESESVDTDAVETGAEEGTAETVQGTEESKTETETETTTEEMTETVTEEIPQPSLEELVLEGPLRSTTETFLIDTTAPYNGEYLLVANTNPDASGTYESSGTLPVTTSASAALYAEATDNEVFSGIDKEEIYDLDKWGRGLIDPQSHLPELEIDDSAPAVYSQRSITAEKEESYTVGKTRTFYLENGAEGVYNATTCYCVAVGDYCTVWVPKNDPIYVKNPSRMKGYMETLAAEFDKQFPKMTEMFGSKETADALGDNDGKTALLCYDINGDGTSSASSYVGGYFFAADLKYPRFSNATGSNSDCLHIDSWQGMYRDTANNELKDVEACFGTIVHELQHMINFSICRDHEPVTGDWPATYNYTITTPTYLNEAYSMAAEHLCYGDDMCYDRVWYYNAYGPYTIASGNVSLFRWGYYDTLSNYALSYLFGQYIRTQYENGATIYRDTMNELDGSTELLSIIADKLGVTESELLFNFRAALCLKNATGKYGFRGEDWADAIDLFAVEFDGTPYLYPGAAAVVPMNGTFTPSGAGEHIMFAAMYPSKTDTSVADPVITVEDILNGKSVSLKTSTSGAKIYYTLDGKGPDDDCTLYTAPFEIKEDGSTTVKAVAITTTNGTKKVSKVVSETIEMEKTKEVVSSQTETDIRVGTEIALSTATEGAEIYYTTDGSDPYDEDTLTVNGVLYTQPFVMGREELVIRAHAQSEGNTISDIAEFTYIPYIVVTDIKLSAETNVLYTNMDGYNTVQMAAELQPAEAVFGDLDWASSDASVATVDEKGVVTAAAPGTVKIIASANGISASYDITVKSVVKSLALNNQSLTINRNKGTLQLDTTVSPTDASDKRLTYTIEPTDRVGDEQGAASVDENGLVTAIRDGVVKITIVPTDNVANVEPVVEYITISNQKSYNSTYMPKLSSKLVTLNKQSVNPYALQIYAQGAGTSVISAAFSENSSYAQYFAITREAEDSNNWQISLTEEGRTNLKRGTYRIPLILQTEVAFGNIRFDDTFSYTMRIQVKDTSARVTVDKVTVNRYYSKTEYPLSVRSSNGAVTILGIEDMENNPGFTENFTVSDDYTMLKLAKSVDEFTTYRGRPVVKGYLRVQVEGYMEQLVPITVSISEKAPTLAALDQKFVLNYDLLKTKSTITVTLSEKVSSRQWKALENMQSAVLDQESRYYEELNEVIPQITVNGAEVTLTFDADKIKAKTYRVPLLITTDELVGVPVEVTISVQRQIIQPKLTLERNAMSLNMDYQGEVDSVKVKSISQTNVALEGFSIEARKASAASNVDNAVTLTYDETSQSLNAQIVEGSTPACMTYLFDCQPQYADGITSDQKITITVKLHQKQASVKVKASGSIDVLDRENTAVVYKLTKVNFEDTITGVTLFKPLKTSGSIMDGSQAFSCTWNAENGTIIVKANEDFKFIKGKKYAFRFCVEKEHASGSSGSKELLTSDITIKPSQSTVRFYVDKTPVFYRYISETNNIQPIELYTNNGTISSLVLKDGAPLPDGVSVNISEEAGLESISFDGINGTKTPGTYNCQFSIVMNGQLCEEATGKPKPLTCRVRIVIH